MSSSDELRRLEHGPGPGEAVPGIGLAEIEAACPDGAAPVLDRCRAALAAVVAAGELPPWLDEHFVTEAEKAVAPAPDPADDAEARIAALDRQQWTRLDWLWWFEAEQRYWWWWDAAIPEPDRLRVQVAMADWPFPWDALRFLLRAAGASEVREIV